MYFACGPIAIYSSSEPSEPPIQPGEKQKEKEEAFEEVPNACMALQTCPVMPSLLVECTETSLCVWSNLKNRICLGRVERYTSKEKVTKKNSKAWLGWKKDFTSPHVAVLAESTNTVEVYRFDFQNCTTSEYKLPAWMIQKEETNVTRSIKKVDITPLRQFSIDVPYPKEQGRCLTSDQHFLYIGGQSSEIHAFTWDGEYQFSMTVPQNQGESRGACAFITSIRQTKEATWLACIFESKDIFVLEISKTKKQLQAILPILESLRSGSHDACVVAGLYDRVAVGWTDASISLYRLEFTVEGNHLKLMFLRDVSLTTWGYDPSHFGAVSCLSWSSSRQAIAVGYERGNILVFSILGALLMSTYSLSSSELKMPRGMASTYIKSLTWGIQDGKLLFVPSEVREYKWKNVDSCLEHASDDEVADEEAEQLNQNVSTRTLADLFTDVECSLQKDDDGLCLCLSGEPKKHGCWIRSNPSFVARSNGQMGPAEASNLLEGGDILISINGVNVITVPFENIIKKVQSLSNGLVTLGFLRVSYARLFQVCVQALEGKLALFPPLSEDETVWEYALRNQAMYGDCTEEAPRFVDFEKRAMYDGWMNIQGVSQDLAMQRYVRFVLSLISPWNPKSSILRICQAVHDAKAIDRFESIEAIDRIDHIDKPHQPLPTSSSLLKKLPLSSLGLKGLKGWKKSPSRFGEVNLVRSNVSTRSNGSFQGQQQQQRMLLTSTSPCIFLLGNDSLHISTSCPWNPTSFRLQSVALPSTYVDMNWPLRLGEASPDGLRICLAGRRGLALYSIRSNHWRLFGNAQEESEVNAQHILWPTNDVLLIIHRRSREDDLAFLFYPRNHLDTSSVLLDQKLTLDPGETLFFVALDPNGRRVYCLTSLGLTVYSMSISGSLPSNDLQVSIAFEKRTPFPSKEKRSKVRFDSLTMHAWVDVFPLPRLRQLRRRQKLPHSHINDASSTTSTSSTSSSSSSSTASLPSSSSSSSWFSFQGLLDIFSLASDGMEWANILPRLAVLDSFGTLLVWDVETQRLDVLCENVNRIIPFTQPMLPSNHGSNHGSNESSTTTTTTVASNSSHHQSLASNSNSSPVLTSSPYSQGFLVYGTQGTAIWFPTLDGFSWCTPPSPPSSVEASSSSTLMQAWVQDFLDCQDPYRKTSWLRNENHINNYHKGDDGDDGDVDGEGEGTRSKVVEANAWSVHAKRIRPFLDVFEEYHLRGCTERSFYEKKDAPSLLGLKRSFVSTVDYLVSWDPLLEFNIDMSLLGIHEPMGLLIGVSQDLYTPKRLLPAGTPWCLASVECFDVQPKVHTYLQAILRFFLHFHEMEPLVQWLEGTRDLPLTHVVLESLLFSIIEDCYYGRCQHHRLACLLLLLRDRCTSTFHELVAHTARKIEPNRLPLLFPLAGNALALFEDALCLGHLDVASNYLLILGIDGITAGTSQDRIDCAKTLFQHCLKASRWRLAKNVLRVSREWILEQPRRLSANDRLKKDSSIHEDIEDILSTFTLKELMQYRFENVLYLIQEFNASLPSPPKEIRHVDVNNEDAISKELCRVFELYPKEWTHLVELGDDAMSLAVRKYEEKNRSSLKTLLDAVAKAQLQPFVSIIIQEMKKADEGVNACLNRIRHANR